MFLKYSYNATFLPSVANSMNKPLSVLGQYLVPQHALTHLAGQLGESQIPWLKNILIRHFVSRFDVDMTEAEIQNPYDYPSFNSFFTRHLKPGARPIAPPPAIVSPADGFISHLGKIEDTSLIQAKGMYFTLTSLLGGSDSYSQLFQDGLFATIYLSPKDYHRVHMPADGRLRETIFVPGKLFSVNPMTTAAVPDLFARNERLICIFDTKHGPMAVIFVGAMLVGSIQTVWHANTTSSVISYEAHQGESFKQGEEIGHFKMGSTVIVLFGKNQAMWRHDLLAGSRIKMGHALGSY